jgi:hypothetical protein
MNAKTILIIALVLSFVAATLFLVDTRNSHGMISVVDAKSEQLQSISEHKSEKQSNHQHVTGPPTDREKEIRVGLERANVPIRFYGKVVDQEGAPLEGVKVNFRVVRSGALNLLGGIDSDTSPGQTQSDARGLFSVEGHKGINIAVERLEKGGYRETKGIRRVFGYSSTPEVFSPDPSKPVTFVLGRNDLAGKIKKTRWKLSVVWDGVPRSYDIDSGMPNGSGELVLTALKNTPTLPDRADWSLEISCRGGGIVAVDQGAGFVAPIAGYSEKVGWRSEVKWRNFRSGVTEQVFVRRHNGAHARLSISIYAEPTREKNSLIVDCFIAEDGGRILE